MKKNNHIFYNLEERLMLSVADDELFATSQAYISFENQITKENNKVNEILIIDANVENYQTIIEQLPQDTKVFILKDNQDGLEQINQLLANELSINNLHILSHSSDGKLQLGNTTISNENIASHQSNLKALGNKLSKEGNIFFYGCNLAQSQEGKEFINLLSALTSADISASDDLTGNRDLGGDFELEFQVGEVETSIIEKQLKNINYDSILRNDNGELFGYNHSATDVDGDLKFSKDVRISTYIPNHYPKSALIFEEGETDSNYNTLYLVNAPKDANVRWELVKDSSTIKSGYDNHLFNINEKTGKVTFIEAPDFENPKDNSPIYKTNTSYRKWADVFDHSNSTQDRLGYNIIYSGWIEEAKQDNVYNIKVNASYVDNEETVFVSDVVSIVVYDDEIELEEYNFNVSENSKELIEIIIQDSKEGLHLNYDYSNFNIGSIFLQREPKYIEVEYTHYLGGENKYDFFYDHKAQQYDNHLFELKDNKYLVFKQAPDYENPQDKDGDNTYEVVLKTHDGYMIQHHILTIVVEDQEKEVFVPIEKDKNGKVVTTVIEEDEENKKEEQANTPVDKKPSPPEKVKKPVTKPVDNNTNNQNNTSETKPSPTPSKPDAPSINKPKENGKTIATFIEKDKETKQKETQKPSIEPDKPNNNQPNSNRTTKQPLPKTPAIVVPPSNSENKTKPKNNQNKFIIF